MSVWLSFRSKFRCSAEVLKFSEYLNVSTLTHDIASHYSVRENESCVSKLRADLERLQSELEGQKTKNDVRNCLGFFFWLNFQVFYA